MKASRQYRSDLKYNKRMTISTRSCHCRNWILMMSRQLPFSCMDTTCSSPSKRMRSGWSIKFPASTNSIRTSDVWRINWRSSRLLAYCYLRNASMFLRSVYSIRENQPVAFKGIIVGCTMISRRSGMSFRRRMSSYDPDRLTI